MLIPRNLIETTIKDGQTEVSVPLLMPHLDFKTRPGTSQDSIGTIGVTPVLAHDRQAIVVNDFELGVLYTNHLMNLDTQAYARRDKVVGMFAGLPVELV